MDEKWKSYGRVLFTYLIVFILVSCYIVYANYVHNLEIKQGFNKVIDDLGHVLGILIIWVYLLVFIWASAGIGVFIAYYKKRAYYVQIFALIFVLSSIALGIMTLA